MSWTLALVEQEYSCSTSASAQLTCIHLNFVARMDKLFNSATQAVDLSASWRLRPLSDSQSEGYWVR